MDRYLGPKFSVGFGKVVLLDCSHQKKQLVALEIAELDVDIIDLENCINKWPFGATIRIN